MKPQDCEIEIYIKRETSYLHFQSAFVKIVFSGQDIHNQEEEEKKMINC